MWKPKWRLYKEYAMLR